MREYRKTINIHINVYQLIAGISIALALLYMYFK